MYGEAKLEFAWFEPHIITMAITRGWPLTDTDRMTLAIDVIAIGSTDLLDRYINDAVAVGLECMAGLRGPVEEMMG